MGLKSHFLLSQPAESLVHPEFSDRNKWDDRELEEAYGRMIRCESWTTTRSGSNRLRTVFGVLDGEGVCTWMNWRLDLSRIHEWRYATPGEAAYVKREMEE